MLQFLHRQVAFLNVYWVEYSYMCIKLFVAFILYTLESAGRPGTTYGVEVPVP